MTRASAGSRRSITAVLTTFVLVGSGCALWDDSVVPATAEFLSPTTIPDRPDAPLVIQVGDSITQFSQAEVSSAFTARRWTNAVVGHSGTRTDENRARILGAAAQRPDALVIQLGTNDALWADAPFEVKSPAERSDRIETSIDRIGQVLDDIDDLECVVWVDVNDWTDTQLLRLSVSAPPINEALARLDKDRTWLHLAPYAAMFRPGTPETTAFVDTNFDPERLHPVSVAARQRFAEVVAATVASQCSL